MRVDTLVDQINKPISHNIKPLTNYLGKLTNWIVVPLNIWHKELKDLKIHDYVGSHSEFKCPDWMADLNTGQIWASLHTV